MKFHLVKKKMKKMNASEENDKENEESKVVLFEY